jgi:hypothetical protein
MVGFDVWKGSKSLQVQWLYCNKQGFNETNSAAKQTEKASMRTQCKGYVKEKMDPKEGCWFFNIVILNHNHQLNQEKRMTRFIHAHKTMEDGVKNLKSVMTRAGVHHQEL